MIVTILKTKNTLSDNDVLKIDIIHLCARSHGILFFYAVLFFYAHCFDIITTFLIGQR